MVSLEVMMVREAKASGISIEENYRLAKQGQFIMRTYPPKSEVDTSSFQEASVNSPNWFQIVVAISRKPL